MNEWFWSEALIDLFVHLGLPEWASVLIAFAIGGTVLAVSSLTLALGLIWITRKVISRMQDRIGPNRVGPYGLFQTLADVTKLLTKEDIMPANADWISYQLAPIISVFGVLLSLAVMAFAPGIIGADLNIGVLYLVALGSLGIMSALMAGWSSNNKYALLAGFRVVAQLLSYELPMVLAMLTPVLLVGSMRLSTITEAQGLSIFGLDLGLGWFAFLMPGAFLIFFISALAEAERPPFDLLEAESELIAGFHIEYSGMKFAMFFLAQFLNTFFLGAVAVMLFLGGWQGPFVTNLFNLWAPAGILLGFIYFNLKIFAFYLLVMWIMGTVPRLRVDQMMSFAWKVLIPLILGLVLIQMVALKLPGGAFVQYGVLFLANVGVIYVVLNVLQNHFTQEASHGKRAFEPQSLIGTMQPVSPSGD